MTGVFQIMSLFFAADGANVLWQGVGVAHCLIRDIYTKIELDYYIYSTGKVHYEPF